MLSDLMPYLLLGAAILAAYLYTHGLALPAFLRPAPAPSIPASSPASMPMANPASYAPPSVNDLFAQAHREARYQAEQAVYRELADKAATEAVERFKAPFSVPAAQAPPPGPPAA